MTYSLDLFSTRQTNPKKQRVTKGKKDRAIYDECLNNAPFFAYQIKDKKWGIVQGCCNDWNCPKCGQQRAREEYGRFVQGARELAKTNDLFMLTLTCRGRDLALQDAESGFYGWTNSLLTRLRTESKRKGKTWAYAGVTERQKRQHPHAHYITTYCPDDAVFIAKGERKSFTLSGNFFPAKHDTLQSYKLETACVECGLGEQYDISKINTIEGASRYVAKYLFHEDMFNTKWPKGWRRVRYSNNWPKLPEVKGDAFILLTSFDWYKLSRLAVIVQTKDDNASKIARRNLDHTDTIVI